MWKTTTRFACSCVFSLLLCICEHSAATTLSVGNGRASQRAGTRLVDVYYDISGGVPPYTVTLEGSSDGGTTWTLPVTTVSGNVGAGVPAGNNLLVTWNAGADWAGQVSANVKFQVNVTDSAPAPDVFALIPAGSFQMGDQSSPRVGIHDELPVHTVQVSDFYMAKNLVTKADWDTVQTWGVTHGYTDLKVGAGKASNHPVQQITWYDMVKWCDARSEKEGLTPCYTVSGTVYRTGSSDSAVCNWSANGYRLPSEAEWEKAARGGLIAQNFPWGNTISQTQANYYSDGYYSYDVSPTRGFHPTYNDGNPPYTSPVGSFAANGYGLYDMAGNVWEWCWDWYGDYTAGSQTDPRGPASGSYRVFRGGSWDMDEYTCLVAARNALSPGSYDNSIIGFRVARSSVP